MNSIDASLLQLVGLCYRMRQAKTLSEEQLKLVDSIASKVQKDVEDIRFTRKDSYCFKKGNSNSEKKITGISKGPTGVK